MAPPDAMTPLAGRRVLVTRAAHQTSELSTRIRDAGGEPVEAPTIRTRFDVGGGLVASVRDLVAGRFVGVCLTSVNGVDALADAFALAGEPPAPTLRSLRFVAAVGPRTAGAVTDRLGVTADIVPPQATGAALGAVVPSGEGEVLLPRGDLAARDLDALLAARGYTPVAVTAYRTEVADALPDGVPDALAVGGIDLLAFTSASTVRGFVTLVAGRPWSARVVSIGPVTSAACRAAGIEVAAEADPHDLDGLLDALARAAGRDGPYPPVAG